MKIYIANISPLLNTNVFNSLLQQVSPNRRQKIEKYHFMKDKVLSLGAGLLLNYGLHQMGVEQYELFDNEYGKPYLKPPDDHIYFNLSHSGEYVMAVFDNDEIGCDIEKITDIDAETVKYCFPVKDSEMSGLVVDNAREFFELWTRKESLSKAIGTGLTNEIRQMPASAFSQNTCRFSGRRYYLHSWSMEDGYVATVCALNNDCTEMTIHNYPS